MITRDELAEHFSYNPKTGQFIRLSGKRKDRIGKVAGSLHHSGYINIKVNSKSYSAHRLACLYMNGSLPEEQVDHINHNRSDNRFENLRVCSRQDNMKNLSLRSTNTSGVTGVSWSNRNKAWMVKVGVENIGQAHDFDDACLLRSNALAKRGYHENHGKDL